MLRLGRPTTVDIETPERGTLAPAVGRRQPTWWPRDLYYGWVLVVALGLTTIISYGTTYYLFGVLVVPVGHDLGWSRADISGAYALGTVLAGLLGVPIGRAVDRHGARLLMAAGSALGGCSLLGLSAVHALWQFYLLWAGGLGVATALTFYPVTFTIVANWFARRRGRALALLTLLGGLASPIFIPLAGALVLHLGWRTTLMVLGLLQLGIALPVHAIVVRRHPEDLGLHPDGAHPASDANASQLSGQTLHAALRQLPFWTLTGAFSLTLLATNVVLVHAVAYLISRGYDGAAAASIVGAVGLASLPGRFLLNLLSDRIGPQLLLSLCLATQAVGVLLLVHGASLGWLIAYVVVYGAAFGAVSPLKAAVMASHFGRRAYGSITAVQGVPVALCAGVGPVVAGWLYDRFASYQLPFSLCVGAFVLAAVSVALTPRPASS
ncbi:MAG TPA: MFS transporter [Chloroflexota bacterium]|nr:MFS transporter [Chloroflexota bacterium]